VLGAGELESPAKRSEAKVDFFGGEEEEVGVFGMFGLTGTSITFDSSTAFETLSANFSRLSFFDNSSKMLIVPFVFDSSLENSFVIVLFSSALLFLL